MPSSKPAGSFSVSQLPGWCCRSKVVVMLLITGFVFGSLIMLINLLIVMVSKPQATLKCSSISIRAIQRGQISFKQFSWPYEGDITGIVRTINSGGEPPVAPPYPVEYSYVHECPEVCSTMKDSSLFLIAVKSTVYNFKRRQKIRSTWGNPKVTKLESYRTIFFLGDSLMADDQLSSKIKQEQTEYHDLVQANFADSYRNNSVKSIMTYQWLRTNCRKSKYILFVDDDMNLALPKIAKILESRPPDEKQFFSGLATGEPSNPPIPMRDPCNKWFLSLKDYPFEYWPNYCHGGFYMVATSTVADMATAMLYTQPIWIDDAYIGIVRHKLDIPITRQEKILINCDVYSKRQLAAFVADPNMLANHCDFVFKSS